MEAVATCHQVPFPTPDLLVEAIGLVSTLPPDTYAELQIGRNLNLAAYVGQRVYVYLIWLATTATPEGSFSIEESATQFGTYAPVPDAPVVTFSSPADSIEVISFVPTQPWVHVLLTLPEESDVRASAGFFRIQTA